MVLRHLSADSAASSARGFLKRTTRNISEATSTSVEEGYGSFDTNWERTASNVGVRKTRHGSVVSIDDDCLPDMDSIRKKQLLENLKKEVKNIMEEAVSRRSMDLYSNYVNALCASVEACLLDGLRKRMLGLFGQRTTMALLHTVAKSYSPADQVLQKTNEMSRGRPQKQWCWIIEALHMRVLSGIVHHISTSKNLRRLYEPNALMVDRSKGGMVSALLLGPCAVTFKRMTDVDNAADEVVRQSSHAVKSNGSTTTRPPLSVTRQGSSIVSSLSERQSISKDYVYSLHHNFKSSLLYGKNNVCVADSSKDETKGYLSLHKNSNGGLILKWTPNQLMHASSQPSSAHQKEFEHTYLLKQAINIDIEQIIYIHLHQKDELSPSSLIFVNTEGVQSPPLQFPIGQHSLVFLSSLETGLAPINRLDPPLWTSQGRGDKILPKLRRKTSSHGPMLDYVFRIVRSTISDRITPSVGSSSTPPESPKLCFSMPNSPNVTGDVMDSLVNVQIGQACQSMRNQILARAFFGWLSYCRHLLTIRTHLLYLVEKKELRSGELMEPVDEEFWIRCRAEKTRELEEEFLLRVYWKGIDGSDPKELRRRAWPYLLGLFDWAEEPEPKTSQFTEKYRLDVDEWRILEAEVRRMDEEAFNAARQRKISPPVRECSLASDVFEDEEETEENGTNTLDGVVEEKEEDVRLSLFAANLHRIEKDVERCDRNLIFFSNKENLESLRRIMCTYVMRNLEEGYVQGMCDILAPLLVVFEDEALTLECFSLIMNRMKENFPQRKGMDECLSNLRSLIQVVDPQIFSIFTSSSDFTHLYFSYRWFLLDFKRELSYDGTYRVWETIWASSKTLSPHFQLFFALAMITNYREVIIDNCMDFTDLIKFFNEMAERHDANRLLDAARGHLAALQKLVLQLR